MKANEAITFPQQKVVLFHVISQQNDFPQDLHSRSTKTEQHTWKYHKAQHVFASQLMMSSNFKQDIMGKAAFTWYQISIRLP